MQGGMHTPSPVAPHAHSMHTKQEAAQGQRGSSPLASASRGRSRRLCCLCCVHVMQELGRRHPPDCGESSVDCGLSSSPLSPPSAEEEAAVSEEGRLRKLSPALMVGVVVGPFLSELPLPLDQVRSIVSSCSRLPFHSFTTTPFGDHPSALYLFCLATLPLPQP